MSAKANRSPPCELCGTYCELTGGVAECPGEDMTIYQTRYECEGHPLGPGIPCGWRGVLAGTDQRDPVCPSCGGWVRKAGGARLRRVQ